MNKHLKNLNRVEFIVTYDCTGKCKHCSVGEGNPISLYLDKELAKNIVYNISKMYNIESIMTFGGEPLLNSECVCAIHSAATEMKIPKRQLITNGFFSKDTDKIKAVCKSIANSGVNDLLLSVDAFHQETIPIDVVKMFANEIVCLGVNIRTNPAWLVNKKHDNPYNNYTHKLCEGFKQMGIQEGEGNVVFPEGNALKYLSEYFKDINYINPYAEDPENLKSISIEPDGTLFGKSLHKESAIKILNEYKI